MIEKEVVLEVKNLKKYFPAYVPAPSSSYRKTSQTALKPRLTHRRQ